MRISDILNVRKQEEETEKKNFLLFLIPEFSDFFLKEVFELRFRNSDTDSTQSFSLKICFCLNNSSLF